MQSNLHTPQVLVREFSFALPHQQGSVISPHYVLALAQGSGNHLYISSQTVPGTHDFIYLDLNFSSMQEEKFHLFWNFPFWKFQPELSLLTQAALPKTQPKHCHTSAGLTNHASGKNELSQSYKILIAHHNLKSEMTDKLLKAYCKGAVQQALSGSQLCSYLI